MKPSVHLLRCHAEGNRGKEYRSRHLTFPIVRRSMARIRHTLRNRVKHLKGRDKLPCAIDMDLQTAITHFTDKLREILCCGTQTWKIFGPSGNHFPLVYLLVHGICLRLCRDRWTPFHSIECPKTEHKDE